MEGKQKTTKMRCNFCDYEWTTLSQREFVCCPNCLRKNKVEERKEDV